jgi:hypothetical protein
MSSNKKRAPVISLTIFFLILLSSGLSGYYLWQGFLHGFDKYLPILCSTLLLDGLGVFALVFKVSFETRRRAMVPFVASLALLVVCSIHLAALANMRTGILSRDEDDARSKTLDDDRHARNVRDANALVETNCAGCKPERKRRMYQSEMSRLEKLSAVEKGTTTVGEISTRSWGRRYVEDFATAVQLIFGLLCGLAMLVNNFVRLYADEPETEPDEFPSELEVENRTRARRENFTPKSDSERQSLILSQKSPPLSLEDGVRKDALKRLREHLKVIAFQSPGQWFKADLVRGGVTIRLFERQHGHEICISQTTQSDKLLVAVDREDFRERLIDELRHQGFEI